MGERMRLFRYEQRYDRLLPLDRFLGRLARSLLASAALICLVLAGGVAGYRWTEGMGLVDAFANASMILSGMGPLTPLVTDGGKLFAAIYALVSGLVVVFATTILLAPVVHRVLHRFHVDDGDG